MKVARTEWQIKIRLSGNDHPLAIVRGLKSREEADAKMVEITNASLDLVVPANADWTYNRMGDAIIRMSKLDVIYIDEMEYYEEER